VPIEVGSFTPQSSTGNQVINHSLGVTPKAIIAWFTGKAPGSFGPDVITSLGFSDGSASACIANTIEDAIGTSDTYRRIEDDLFAMISVTGTLLKAGTLSAWDSTTFTINHNTAGAQNGTVCYMLIAGDDVEAKVGSFDTITTSGGSLPDTQAITGVGFQPDGLMILQVGGSITGFPQLGSGGIFGIGWADVDESQAGFVLHDPDAQAVTENANIQLTDSMVLDIAPDASGPFRKILLDSYDADGFTLLYTANFAQANPMVYFAIRGVRIKAGAFNKSTGAAPVSQGITGMGFEPTGLLLSSGQKATSASGSAGVRLGFGGTDGTNERSLALQSQDNVTTSQANEIVKTDKVFMVCNNDTPGIDAEADLTSLDADGFTLNWTTNFGEATEILYLAFGDLTKLVQLEEDVVVTEAVTSPERDSFLAEGVTISDLLSLPIKFVSINEAIQILDAVARLVVLAETVTITDLVVKDENTKLIQLTEDVGINDQTARIVPISEIISIVESMEFSAFVSLQEDVRIVDTVTLLKSIILSENVSIADLVGRFVPLTENLTIEEALVILKELKGRIDRVTVGDSVKVFKTSIAAFQEPEETYEARTRKRHLVVDRPIKLH